MPDAGDGKRESGAKLYALVEDLRRSTWRLSQQANGKYVVQAHREEELHREWESRLVEVLREVVRMLREK